MAMLGGQRAAHMMAQRLVKEKEQEEENPYNSHLNADEVKSGVRISRRGKTLSISGAGTGKGSVGQPYLKYLPLFQEAHTAHPVNSMKEVDSWSELHVAAWIAAINFGEFEEWAPCFVEHMIDGKALFKIDVNMLDEIGIHNLGDRMVLMDVIDQLKRRCSKPGTRDLQVPGWGGCFIKMFTFDWADTSEGKSGAEIKDELMNANTSIALVSTLTWAIAWDLFFGSSTACYCSTSKWEQCLCGTAWDMEGRPLVVFYCFTGISAFMFMFSTIFAILQILMVYEMSDDEEVTRFFELLGNDTQLPGAFLFIGMITFCVPLGVYVVYNVTMGLYLPTPDSDGFAKLSAEQIVQLAFSWTVAVMIAVIVIYGFFYQIPTLISYVYQAKKLAVERDANTIGYEEGVPPVSLVAGAAGVKETHYNENADIHVNGNGHANAE